MKDSADRSFPSSMDQIANHANGSVRFGANVLDDLVSGLRAANDRPATYRRPGTAVLASSMWMDDPELIEELKRCVSVCVVVTKQPKKKWVERPPALLLAEQTGLWQRCFPSLHEFVPGGGDPLEIGPHDRFHWLDGPESEDDYTPSIGGVRELGYRRVGAHLVPIVHSKVMVLGDIRYSDRDVLGHVSDEFWFQPTRLWVGSANFTRASRNSLEMGMWTDDPALVDAATQYLLNLVTLSEPLGEGPDDLTPDLVQLTYDDEAIVDYLRSVEDEFD